MLKDKVVIVTGGSGLLGNAIIKHLSKKEAITINVDIDIDVDVEETDLIKGQLSCDITKPDYIKEAVEQVMEYHGTIDGLVNNAYPRTEDWGSSFEDLKPESLEKNVNWQLISYMVFCQAVLSYMKANQKGSIVNMASIYGVIGNDFEIYKNTNMEPPAAYSAIKGGLINFTRFLASNYGPDGVRINCVSPGGIFDHQLESFVQAYNKKVPLKRMGHPEDIAPAVSFLLSEEARYITGQNLIVDGGWTAI